MSTLNSENIFKLNDNQSRQTELLSLIEYLPKGHINTLYRRGKGYYYLTYRTGKKINNQYLGPVGKVDLKETIEKLRLRDMYKKELKELKTNEKVLVKLVRKELKLKKD